MLSYIHTIHGMSVVVKGRPYHVSPTDPQYDDLVAAVKTGASEDDIYEIINAVARKVEEAARLTPNMVYNGGVIKYLGMPLHGYAVEKLVNLIHTGQETKPLAMFLDRLQNNPSKQTIDDLYSFLEYGKIPITERGTFLAYKAVRHDWKDIHSGKFDNSVGQTLVMPRSRVDDRREVTCSTGFHVCSFEYLPHFSHADGHVVVCEVDPADVVSIPSDYNNTKMRVTGYTVIGEIEGYYKERRNILSEKEIWGEDYVVFAREFDTDEWTEIDATNDKDDAIEYAREELADGGCDGEEWTEVKVACNGMTIFRSNINGEAEF
jgi:hypothetical protein